LTEIGRVGSTYQGSTQLEYLVLPSGVEELLALIAEMLRRPDPPDSEFESTRNWFLSFVSAESPSDRMDEAVAAALCPPGHPYRFEPSGTVESLKTFRKADAMAFLRDHVAPDQIVIVGAGDVAWSTFSEMVKKGFGDWRAAAVSEPALPAIVPLSGDAPIRVVDRPGATQAEIRIVALAPPRDSADVVPLQLLADALGGNFMSRFQQNLGVARRQPSPHRRLCTVCAAHCQHEGRRVTRRRAALSSAGPTPHFHPG
jgi:zinc protease